VAVITTDTMKTLYNFLDNETIGMAMAEVEDLKNNYVWNSSNNFWPDVLLKGALIGSVTQAIASKKLTDAIVNKISAHVPMSRCSRIGVQHYLWHPLSGINMHDDGNRVFGATIYLTPDWDINWGGLFVYRDGDGLKVNPPTYNSININDDSTLHMVTMVSPLVPHPRYTLQIWGIE
jgi:hypothetical protein